MVEWKICHGQTIVFATLIVVLNLTKSSNASVDICDEFFEATSHGFIVWKLNYLAIGGDLFPVIALHVLVIDVILSGKHSSPNENVDIK